MSGISKDALFALRSSRPMPHFRPTSRPRGFALLCCSLTVAALATAPDAATETAPPAKLWEQFPLNGQGTTPAPQEATLRPDKSARVPDVTVRVGKRANRGVFRPPVSGGSKASSAPSAVATSELSSLWTALASAGVGLGLTIAGLVAVAWIKRREGRRRERLGRPRARGAVAGVFRRLGSRAMFVRWKPRASRIDIRRPAFLRPPAHVYAFAHERRPSGSPTLFEARRDDAQDGWRMALGRLRRSRRKVESAPTGGDRPDDEGASTRSIELIGTYSAPAAGSSQPVADDAPTPERREEPGEAPVTPAATAPVEHEPDEPESRPPEHGDAVTAMLRGQIEVAGQRHHALTLVAVRFIESGDEAAPEPEELRERVRAGVREAVPSTEEPALVVDAEDRLVWLALPGLLPRRALTIASDVRRLLSEAGLTSPAAAVGGYPRDGATAEELVAYCRAELERARAHGPVAEWPSQVSR
jgi:hypothetical protein